MRRSHLGLILIAALFAVAVACTREVVVEKEVVKEVPVEKVVTKEVVKEVPVEKVVTVTKEVVKEVPKEVIVEVEKIKEVPVEKVVVVEKVVTKEVQVEAAAEESVLTVRMANMSPQFTPHTQGRGDMAPVSYTHLTLPTICSV